MKKAILVSVSLACHILIYSQKDNSTIPFIAKVNIDWDDRSASKDRFFSILIPANFDYDTTFDFAMGYKDSNFFQIHANVRFDYEEFLEKVSNDGKYDLVKYAQLMTREHFSFYDTVTVSGVKRENIRTINGISTLKVRYDLKETSFGVETSKRNILYLIPMFPKNPVSFDTNYQVMIFLTFSSFMETDEKTLGMFAGQIISTIKPLK